VQPSDVGGVAGPLKLRVQEQRTERCDRSEQVHEVEDPVEVVVLGNEDGKHGRHDSDLIPGAPPCGASSL